MKLHLRAVIVLAAGAALGTAACFQVANLSGFDDDGVDASTMGSHDGGGGTGDRDATDDRRGSAERRRTDRLRHQ